MIVLTGEGDRVDVTVIVLAGEGDRGGGERVHRLPAQYRRQRGSGQT